MHHTLKQLPEPDVADVQKYVIPHDASYQASPQH